MLTFNEQQKGSIAKELQRKFVMGEALGHEIVVALTAMAKSGRITTDDISQILMFVYFGNAKGAKRAVDKAKRIANDSMIDQIIIDVDKNKL